MLDKRSFNHKKGMDTRVYACMRTGTPVDARIAPVTPTYARYTPMHRHTDTRMQASMRKRLYFLLFFWSIFRVYESFRRTFFGRYRRTWL
jgi:hypothetical protein